MIVFIYLKLKERAVLFGIDFVSLITESGISCNKTCPIAFFKMHYQWKDVISHAFIQCILEDPGAVSQFRTKTSWAKLDQQEFNLLINSHRSEFCWWSLHPVPTNCPLVSEDAFDVDTMHQISVANCTCTKLHFIIIQH